MGTCESCETCCGNTTRADINMDPVEHLNEDWCNAVKTQNLTGVKILHHTDPGLVNEPIDSTRHSALHFAVQNKNTDLIDYLLNNGANVNVQGGPDYNSALHEAVRLQDFKTVKQLFSYGINDELKNYHNKTAIQLCNKKHKREFTKAKQFKEKTLKERMEKMKKKSRQQKSAVILGGINLDEASEKTIKKYVIEKDAQENFYRRKKEEIANRDMAITQFGEESGIEADEIAMALQQLHDPDKIWTKLIKRKALEITKQTDIYKLLYGLTVIALKKKNPRAKKPPQHAIKQLTLKLCKKLPKKKGKVTLEKQVFIKEMHKILYALHDQLVQEESELS